MHSKYQATTVSVLFCIFIAQAQLTYTTSWYGNTSGIPENHIMQAIEDLSVTPDGHVYGCTGWDEGGSNVSGFYKGALVSRGHESGTGAWGRSSMGRVTADARYYYQTMKEDGPDGMVPDGQSRQEVKRYNPDGSTAGFSGGKGYDSSCLEIITSTQVGI